MYSEVFLGRDKWTHLLTLIFNAGPKTQSGRNEAANESSQAENTICGKVLPGGHSSSSVVEDCINVKDSGNLPHEKKALARGRTPLPNSRLPIQPSKPLRDGDTASSLEPSANPTITDVVGDLPDFNSPSQSASSNQGGKSDQRAIQESHNSLDPSQTHSLPGSSSTTQQGGDKGKSESTNESSPQQKREIKPVGVKQAEEKEVGVASGPSLVRDSDDKDKDEVDNVVGENGKPIGDNSGNDKSNAKSNHHKIPGKTPSRARRLEKPNNKTSGGRKTRQIPQVRRRNGLLTFQELSAAGQKSAFREVRIPPLPFLMLRYSSPSFL
jgi:hypothetical protein